MKRAATELLVSLLGMAVCMQYVISCRRGSGERASLAVVVCGLVVTLD